MHIYPPVGSISTQLTKQAIARAKNPKAKKPRRSSKIPDLQEIARRIALQSVGLRRPTAISGSGLEAVARKSAGKSLRGWR